MRPMWRWSGAAAVTAALLGLPVLSAPATPVPATATADEVATGGPGVERLRVDVLETYPHDTDAFTQGLELHDGLLYESTGLYGESEVRVVEPETGEVQHAEPLPDTAFGEGLTLVDDTVWQLTWRESVAFRYDAASLEEIDQASYDGEGWGLCHDRDRDVLVMSDGSPELTFRDPETFEPLSSVPVTQDGEPRDMVNELECVDGAVWANIWLTDEIVRIDPETGEVTAVVDAAGLLSEEEASGVDVLNGIAAVPDDDTFLITGKLWPWMFLVRFEAA